MRGVFLIAGLTAMFTASLAYSHGVNYGVFHERAMAIRFSYAGGEPMSYVEAKVFGPQSSPDVEFQNGRTDARGVFAFVPDRPGAWRVEAWDVLGHKGSITVAIVKSTSDLGPANHQVGRIENGPTAVKIFLGLSIIANLALAFAVTRRQKLF